MRKINFLLIIAFFFCAFAPSLTAAPKDIKVLSPDKKTELTVNVAEKINISIHVSGEVILPASSISMEIMGMPVLGQNAKIASQTVKFVNTQITPAVKIKRAVVPDVYNELEIKFKGDYSLKFRVYNDGVAYRFVTRFKNPVKVKAEEMSLNLAPADSCWYGEDFTFYSHTERHYDLRAVKDITDKQMAVLPVVVKKTDGFKLIVAESDLMDYPGMWISGLGQGKSGLRPIFPNHVAQALPKGDRDWDIKKRDDYLAETSGNREFPWRVLALAENDAKIIENDIVWRLGRPQAFADASWIKPGKVAWDWWNDWNIYGVDFKSGINTETYKYYIDFAAKYKLEYVILDEGWSDPADLMKTIPEMDMDALMAYAKQKNVGIILWANGRPLEEKWDQAFDRFEKWGVKGLKVDFLQRDDQWMVNFYERIAKETAKRKMLIDYHGAYKPTGMEKTYPNNLSREGVFGLENNKWSKDVTPKHNVTLPFTRMFCGPMDYTPGAMINCIQKNFSPVYSEPCSQGTRCHQLAMFVIYESPLQMLADNPSNYMREPEMMEFLGPVPTVWDETIAINGEISKYLTVARRNGTTWYLGAMTNWTKREMDVDLKFLGEGKYKMTVWQDGPNADKTARDFQMKSQEVTSASKVKIKLAQGGGFAARIEKL
jgi:alpha-glucosidase